MKNLVNIIYFDYCYIGLARLLFYLIYEVVYLCNGAPEKEFASTGTEIRNKIKRINVIRIEKPHYFIKFF